MSSQISVIMSATQGPAGPAGAAGSAGPAGAQGEAGPAGPAGAFTDAGITSGTSMAYTAVLADRPEPLTAGYSFLIVPHVTNGVSPTISLSGGTAQPIWVKGAPIPAGAMVANTPYALRSDGTRCHVEGQLNLSADDIAGISGVINDAGTTGGTSTAYTATLASRPNPLTNGYTFVCVFNVTNGPSATIALSSGTAQPLYANGAAAVAGDIVAGAPVLCRSDGTNVHILGVIGGYPNFGRVQFGTGSYADNIYAESGLIYTKTDAGQIMIYGGYNSGGGFYLNGNTRSSNPGCVTGFLGSASGARWSLQDKNAAEQLRVDETGVLMGGNASRGILQWNGSAAGSGLYAATDALEFSIIMGSYLTYGGPQIYGYGSSHSVSALQGFMCMYPGKSGAVLQLQSYSYGNQAYLEHGDAGTKNVGRKVSIPSGGAWTTLVAIDGTQALRFATVTAHGTILLEWDGTTLTKLAGATTLVVSGSPSGTEIGFRVSGGNLQASNGTGTSRNGSSGFSIQH